MNDCNHDHEWGLLRPPGSRSHAYPVTVRCKSCGKSPGDAGVLTEPKKQPLDYFKEWLTNAYIDAVKQGMPSDESLQGYTAALGVVKMKLEYFALGGTNTNAELGKQHP